MYPFFVCFLLVLLRCVVTPSIIIPEANFQFIVNQTDSLTIVCNATGVPATAIAWYRSETTPLTGAPDSENEINSRIELSEQDIFFFLGPNGTLLLTSQSLTLSPANGTDTGNYSCVATNVVQMVTQPFTIFVQGRKSQAFNWVHVGEYRNVSFFLSSTQSDSSRPRSAHCWHRRSSRHAAVHNNQCCTSGCP